MRQQVKRASLLPQPSEEQSHHNEIFSDSKWEAKGGDNKTNYFFTPPSHTLKSLAKIYSARALEGCLVSNPLAQLLVQPAAPWFLRAD